MTYFFFPNEAALQTKSPLAFRFLRPVLLRGAAQPRRCPGKRHAGRVAGSASRGPAPGAGTPPCGKPAMPPSRSEPLQATSVAASVTGYLEMVGFGLFLLISHIPQLRAPSERGHTHSVRNVPTEVRERRRTHAAAGRSLRTVVGERLKTQSCGAWAGKECHCHTVKVTDTPEVRKGIA